MTRTQKTNHVALFFVLVCGLLAAGGCSGPIRTSVECIEPGCNRGNAVRIRVYQLADTTRLSTTTLVALWTDDVKELADEYITREREYRLFPGEAPRQLEFKKAKESAFIAIVADLAQPQNENSWRAACSVKKLCPRGRRCRTMAVRIVADELLVEDDENCVEKRRQ